MEEPLDSFKNWKLPVKAQIVEVKVEGTAKKTRLTD